MAQQATRNLRSEDVITTGPNLMSVMLAAFDFELGPRKVTFYNEDGDPLEVTVLRSEHVEDAGGEKYVFDLKCRPTHVHFGLKGIVVYIRYNCSTRSGNWTLKAEDFTTVDPNDRDHGHA